MTTVELPQNKNSHPVSPPNTKL